VDGKDFQIPTTEPYDKSWFLHKFQKPDVRYEVGIGIQTGYIVWVHGPAQRKQKAVVRCRHETCNKQFKQFQILKQVFRHEIRRHKDVLTAIAVITQISITTGNPLFQVDYKTKKAASFYLHS